MQWRMEKIIVSVPKRAGKPTSLTFDVYLHEVSCVPSVDAHRNTFDAVAKCLQYFVNQTHHMWHPLPWDLPVIVLALLPRPHVVQGTLDANAINSAMNIRYRNGENIIIIYCIVAWVSRLMHELIHAMAIDGRDRQVSDAVLEGLATRYRIACKGPIRNLRIFEAFTEALGLLLYINHGPRSR